MNEATGPSAAEDFRRRFGRSPERVVAAPGRINIIGEHVDYQGGLVLPMAIDRYLTVFAATAAGPKTRIHSTALDRTIAMSLPRTVPAGPEASAQPAEWPWARGLEGRVAGVALGLARSASIDLEQLAPMDILIDSALPIGGGVSSSAALGVALALAIAGTHGVDLSVRQIVEIACRSELVGAGVSCGIMDPLAVAAAQAGSALLIDCRNATWSTIPLPERLAWLLVDTGVRHDNSDGRYAARQRECRAAADFFGAADLREAAERHADPTPLPPPIDARARHALTEHDRTLAAAHALRGDDLHALGRLLVEGHASLRDDFEVSCRELDEAVETALAVGGDAVYGARMTGGGFGGCVIVACRTDAADTLRESLARALPARCTTLRVRAANGSADGSANGSADGASDAPAVM